MPKLDTMLRVNRGTIQTVAPLLGSPAIGHGDCAGNSTAVPKAPAVTTDETGSPRLNPCDIGAYESDLMSNTATPTSTNTPTPTLTPTATITPTPTLTPYPYTTGDTIGVYNPTDQHFYLKYNNSTGFADITSLFGNAGDIPLTGDWTGQHTDTIGLYRPASSAFYLSNSNVNPNPDISFTFGNFGDQPFTGRWDAQMLHDGVGVYRPGNGIIYLKRDLSSGPSDYSYLAGIPGSSVQVFGDWTGNSITQYGVITPAAGGNNGIGISASSNESFNLDNTNCGNGSCVLSPYATVNESLGGTPAPNATVVPIAGDWTNNYSDKVGVFNQSTGIFSLKYSLTSGAADNTFLYGQANQGNIPIAGRWLGPTATAFPTVTLANSATPSPMITPTEQGIQFTNFRFNGAEKPLLSAMFWAMYIDSSSDSKYSGTQSESGHLPTFNTYDLNGHTFAAGVTQPRCNPNSTYATEVAIEEKGFVSNIASVEHCYDYRYMSAQAILNGFLSRERDPNSTDNKTLVPYNANDPDSLMGLGMGYLFQNWSDSVGKGSDSETFWGTTILNAYPITQSCKNMYPILAMFALKNNYLSVLDTIGGETDISNLSVAVHWLDSYLQCLVLTQPNSRIVQSYRNSIGYQITQAVADFYSKIPDPTNGAFQVKDASDQLVKNGPVYAIYLCVGGFITTNECSLQWNNPAITTTLTSNYYYNSATEQSACVYNFMYHIVQVKICYLGATTYTIVQPILFIDSNGTITSGNVRGYLEWYSKAFQQANDTSNYMPRYQFNICDPNDPNNKYYAEISNCTLAQGQP